MGKLTQIWKNKSQILEGIINTVIRDEFVEEVAALRIEVCKECSIYDTIGSGCIMPGSQPCCDVNKGGCGCSLALATRSLSKDCPLGKWEALMTEDEEDELDNLKN
jgi:hypothetical protein